ncbi:hypothetical protein BO83DRAFT_454801 [Aspergillus eucalypticola CBS 122712]|uniref:Stress response protein Rds1 n=1 Tax=Aspergillus eucalypticola (strain CBS 122712 / IBT 29274) TaxID=1448314 RepID=A0A317WBP0_ASPEC|nr:uncharacterized protein BO83DRAFT_454801 [Aspergillus eucalypticola CBS 122712]PWY82767.1 hypothetical protein BO83DRAFT_454801 [Aspergillus eucalypticola CBS 122712]
MLFHNILSLASFIGLSLALPKARSSNLDSNPVPGESPLFATYTGKPTPIPANYTRVIPATASGPAGPDDLLFQNLLSAEWIIYSFYQQGVEAFSPSSFSDLGYPNSTYDRIAEIRDNEAGHIRIFQDEISSTSLKPGPCNYSFGFDNDPETFLALQVYIEVNSMAFLTGLVRESNTTDTSSALVAVAEVETRHNVWSLIDIWDVSPFAGPADTVYPYANQILALTNSFVVSGSCPSENPEYPYPNQNLPEIGFVTNTTTGHPGSKIQLEFSNDPGFTEGGDYYAVFFHGVLNISVPFDIKTNETVVPGEFDKGAGIIALAVADEAGAPTENSVLAGPLLLLQQPEKLTLLEP